MYSVLYTIQVNGHWVSIQVKTNMREEALALATKLARHLFNVSVFRGERQIFNI